MPGQAKGDGHESRFDHAAVPRGIALIRDNSDTSWEKWGEDNPYYGVLADDRFRGENLNDERKAEFLATGRRHVRRVLEMAERRCGGMTEKRAALDFGCGVGRLVLPLAEIFEHVTGVDVSTAMLNVAGSNCSERGIQNVELKHSDDRLTQVEGKFDFIHSYLVFQHIPVRRGEKILAGLVDRMNDGGIMAIHLPFVCKGARARRALHRIRRNFSPLSGLVNLARGKRWSEPFMQMNLYDMNRILRLLAERGMNDAFLEIVDAGGYVSAFVIAKKPEYPMRKVQAEHLWAAELGS